MLRRWDERADDLPDEPDWIDHTERAGELAGAVRPFSARAELYSADQAAAIAQWVETALSAPPDVVRSLLFLLIRRAGEEGGWSHDASRLVHHLRRSRFSVSARDAAYVLRTSASLPDTWQASDVLVCASALAARTDAPGHWRLERAVAEFTGSVTDRKYVPAADRSRILRNLRQLRPRPGPRAPVDTTAIAANDGWSAVVLAELAGWAGPADPVNALLHHLSSAAGSRPTRKWLAAAAEVLAADEARQVLRILLEAVASAEGVKAPDRYGWGLVNLVVSGQNADLVRTAGWAAAVVKEDWAVGALAAVVSRALSGTDDSGYIESAKVPHACIASLGMLGSPDAVAALRGLLGTATDAQVRRQAGAALSVAARRSGLRPGELAERLVPRAGLDSGGERIVAAGEVTARVRVAGDGEPEVRWRGRRGWVQRAPARAAGAEPMVRAAVREIGEALAGERRRLECLLAQDRLWSVAQWRELYGEHPVTRVISRGLVWVFDGGSCHGGAGDAVSVDAVSADAVTGEAGTGGAFTGMPSADGRLVTLDGMRDLPAAGTVRLWHPVRAEAGEVAAWRDHLLACGTRQPFEQAFREVHRLTPQEREAQLYSGRHAGQVLCYPRLFALAGEHGWTARYLDPLEGGTQSTASRDFPDARLTVVFGHQALGVQAGDLQVDWCAAGQVIFCKAGDRARKPVRLDKVPDLVFTEAMRDIGLFVSVTARREC
ncbi:MAG TPA: DUF4132 domain-containing protein [Streptosporangiaceae bacterium]